MRLQVDSGGNILMSYILEGCGGFVYKFRFDSEIKDEDFAYKLNDHILFVVDGLTLRFVEGSVIDYEIDMMK